MSARNRFPFTAAQWQELEHQALIFKYMVSGVPIPPELLYSIKATSLDTPFISRLFPHQYPQVSAVGWNYLQMGSGRKIDPEPGRCRRTDGKKWRCSKEAYPDSKYCERHMHRGKNRSRKPVEQVSKTTPLNSSNPSTPAISSITHNSETHPHPHPFHYQSPSAASSHPSLLPDYRNRYVYGEKEEDFFVREQHSGNVRGFTGSSMDDSWQLTPLTMSCSSSSSRYKNCSALQGDYSSYLQLQSFGKYNEMQSKMDRDQEPQKTVHHFFDEWSPKHRESWDDLDDKSSNTGSVSATRLSMSIPNTDSFIFSSNKRNEN
ncbi:hypothetical protein IC582_012052 [Cucumis melo]